MRMQIDFFKEGKGVKPNESEKSRFAKFFAIYFKRFWKLISLNALYLLFCLPVVTIGPATVAMAYVLRRFTEEKLAYAWSDFIKTFKENFKNSFLLSIVFAVVSGIAGVSAYFYLLQALSNPVFFMLFAICLLMLLVVFFSFMHAVILLTSVELSLLKIIKNALILSIALFGPTVLAFAACLLVGLIVAVLFPASLLLVVLFVPVTQWYIVVFILFPQIVKRCSLQKN